MYLVAKRAVHLVPMKAVQWGVDWADWKVALLVSTKADCWAVAWAVRSVV